MAVAMRVNVFTAPRARAIHENIRWAHCHQSSRLEGGYIPRVRLASDPELLQRFELQQLHLYGAADIRRASLE